MRFISSVKGLVVGLASVLASVVLIFGCNEKEGNDVKETGVSEDARLENALKQAKLQQDYRLFALKGRRVTLPGIENKQMENAKLACGIKYLKNTGDVLENEQDRERRRLDFQFAEEFNQIVYPLCLKEKEQS
ncbi:MAG: hypothetical protein HRT38_17230 [Alteromonadaceae bacterium]|nr:hypothetical protein [Alteromonadaceae bacterium]